MRHRSIQRTSVRTGCLLAFLSLVACTLMPMQPQSQVSTPQEVPRDMVVVVGRIELHPPLQPGEQFLGPEQGEDMENTFILHCGDQVADVNATDSSGPAESYVTKLEKDFFIKVRHYPLLTVSGGMFYEAYAPSLRVKARTFSTPLHVWLQPDDHAVYIGTIQYYRDASNNLKSVMIRDDYQWAESQYRKKFGAQTVLRKALAQYHSGNASGR